VRRSWHAAAAAWLAAHAGAARRSPARLVCEVAAVTFRGSRAELQSATALRLEAVIVLIFLAARGVHLGQAAVDLGLAGRTYTRAWLAPARARRWRSPPSFPHDISTATR
jgi:hypothetical protein